MGEPETFKQPSGGSARAIYGHSAVPVPERPIKHNRNSVACGGRSIGAAKEQLRAGTQGAAQLSLPQSSSSPVTYLYCDVIVSSIGSCAMDASSRSQCPRGSEYIGSQRFVSLSEYVRHHAPPTTWALLQPLADQ